MKKSQCAFLRGDGREGLPMHYWVMKHWERRKVTGSLKGRDHEWTCEGLHQSSVFGVFTDNVEREVWDEFTVFACGLHYSWQWKHKLLEQSSRRVSWQGFHCQQVEFGVDKSKVVHMKENKPGLLRGGLWTFWRQLPCDSTDKENVSSVHSNRQNSKYKGGNL